MIRHAFFVVIGLLLGGAAVTLVGPPVVASWALPVVMPVLIITSVLTLLGRSMSGLTTTHPKVIEAARAAGRTGIARVDVLRQTGTQINDQPLCELELTVQPDRGSAYRLAMKRVVAVTEIPRFQPGQELTVVRIA